MKGDPSPSMRRVEKRSVALLTEYILKCTIEGRVPLCNDFFILFLLDIDI